MSKTGAIIIEGHVQGLSNTRSLGSAGIPVYVVDTTDCVARHSIYCKGFWKCPSFESDHLADFLIDLAIKQHFKNYLLLPSNDHAVLTLSGNKKRLSEYYKLITPDLKTIEKIYDKSKLLKVAQSVGVPIPETLYPNEPNPNHVPLSYPVLTRGRFGLDFYKSVGRKAFLASDITELHGQLTQIEESLSLNKIMTQELIPDDGTNKTVSFTAFCLNGEIKAYWMGEKVRQHPIRFGTATFAKSVNVKACYQYSVPLLQALDYTGICEVEYLKDPRDDLYKLIEINARTWLWVGLARACGVDFAMMAYNYVNGLKNDYPKEYSINRYWMNPLTDTVYAIKAICQGELDWVSYLKSIMNNRQSNALFDEGDWKPGISYIFNLLGYMKQR